MCNKIFILGGGPSLTSFDFNKLLRERTIAVNASIFSLPTATFFITIDHSFFSKTKSKYRFFKSSAVTATKVFVVNFDNDYIIENEGQIIDTRYHRVYRLSQCHMIIKSYRSDGIGFTFNEFRNGNNSGYCALQLAVLLGYKEIYLLGIDLCITNKTHFHNMYAWSKVNNIVEYEQRFRTGLDLLKSTDVKVYSCSSISKLNNIIPYIPIEEVL